MEPLERSELRRLRALGRRGMRRRRGAFLLEGFRGVETALGRPGRVDLVVLTPGAAGHERAPRIQEMARGQGVPVRGVAEEEMEELADTRTPAGVMARVRWDPPRDPPAAEVAAALEGKGLRRLLCLDGVGDPGNTGTLLRTADALGIGGALLGRGTVEAGNPKTARSAAGSLLGFDYLAEEVDLPGVLARLESDGWHIWRGEAEGGCTPRAAATGRWALVLGSEGHGLDPAAARVGEALHIPRRPGAESLNVAVAGGILMYLLTRGETS
ncbi:MAG: RNA methyltransferase [bacterium]